MKVRAVASTLISAALIACSSSGGSGTSDAGGANQDGASNPGTDAATGNGNDSGSTVGNTDSGSTGGNDAGGSKHDAGSGGNKDAGGGTTDAGGGGTDGGSSGAWAPPFATGTVCNSSGATAAPPATLKSIIVFMFENDDFASVNGNTSAMPYYNTIASECGVAKAYNDDCFVTNLNSLPHYLALTSGSNCDTGLETTGTGCIPADQDVTTATQLSTVSIFEQVASMPNGGWKSYQEDMPSACDFTTSSTAHAYAAKHNPAAFYSNLTPTCATNDISIPNVTCTTTVNTPCTPAPTAGTNAFAADLANDKLPAFSFVTPTLENDLHDGTATEADNWLATYLPLVLASPAYLRGEVAVFVLFDEMSTIEWGGATPNIFVSPYVTKGFTTSTPIDHFSVLRAWENALGLTTFLGCASGEKPGDAGTCPSDSTTNVRALMNF